MKRILYVAALLCAFDFAAFGQGTPPLRVKEVDGSPNKLGVTTIVVSNGTLTISGNTATITTASGSSDIAIGTTAITGGTTTRVLYDNAGVVGEYTVTGTGNVVMSASPTLTGRISAADSLFATTVTTGTGATAGLQLTADSLTTGNGAEFSSSSVTSGNVFSLASTSTAAASNTQTVLNVATSGANGTATQTTYAARFSNTHTGTSSTNIALQLTASGGTTNTALNVTAGTAAFGDIVTITAATASIGGASSGVLRISNDVSGSLRPTLLSTGNGTSLATYGNGGIGNNGAAYSGSFAAGGLVVGLNAISGMAASSATSSGLIGFGNGSTTIDSYFGRIAAASFRWGAADAAAPVAQTISVQNVVAGTTNTAGATWTLRGSLGTSQGVPGRIHLTGGAMIAASGTTQQTAIDRHISGATKVLTNNSAIAIVNATAATETNAAGVIDYAVEVLDGTDVQYEVGSVAYGVSNKGGVFSGNTATKFGNHQNATSGTLTVTFAISGANPAVLSVNANSSLTPSTGYPRIVYNLRNLGNQAVAIQ